MLYSDNLFYSYFQFEHAKLLNPLLKINFLYLICENCFWWSIHAALWISDANVVLPVN